MPTTKQGADAASPRHVEIHLNRPTRKGSVNALSLLGEHDIATIGDIKDALASVQGNVLVDFSQCSFIDSTTICVLVVDAKERRYEAHQLELLVPYENRTVARTLELVGIARAMTVHQSLP